MHVALGCDLSAGSALRTSTLGRDDRGAAPGRLRPGRLRPGRACGCSLVRSLRRRRWPEPFGQRIRPKWQAVDACTAGNRIIGNTDLAAARQGSDEVDAAAERLVASLSKEADRSNGIAADEAGRAAPLGDRERPARMHPSLRGDPCHPRPDPSIFASDSVQSGHFWSIDAGRSPGASMLSARYVPLRKRTRRRAGFATASRAW